MIRRHLFRLLQRNLGYPLDEDVVYCHYDFVSAVYLVNSAIIVRRKSAVHLCRI
jgi:hypothetical protein